MQHLNTLNKTYESGEILSSDNLNLIINYINQSINAINELMINNDISTGHYEIRYKDSLSEPSPPSTGSSGLSDGWKKSIDSAVYNIWMTLCFVTISNTYGTWTKAIKISAKDGSNGSFTLEAYRNDSAAVIDSVYIPEVIGDSYSSPSFPPIGWTTAILTRTEGEHTWCILRIISFNENNDPIYGKWSVPFRLTGDDGKDGEDGKYIEFIYKHFTSELTFGNNANNPSTWSTTDNNLNSPNNPLREDYTGPSENKWSDNPLGVDDTYIYEYMCQRIFDGNNYSAFTNPVIWSKYGLNGRDGDGIEYIFWGKSEAITDWNAFSLNSQNLVNYPPSWTNNENFQNNEYSGPNGSLWTDDALGINDTTRRFIYMSKRKKITNPLTGISSWDAFSIPVLWNLYTGTSFTSNIFKRSSTKPNKPGANEGSFLHPVPTGWSDGVPAGTNSIWITSRIFSSDGQYPQQEEWNDVQLMSDTESFDVEFSPIESNPGTPTTNPNNWYDPTTDTNTDWTNMIWMATRTKSNGVWGDWNITKIKGEKGEKGEKGDSGSGSSYDDTDLRTAISNLQSALSDTNTTVGSERTRLNGLINNLDLSILNKVENLFDDATWIQNNFPEGSGSSSNFGQLDVENYLLTIGVWTTDGQGNTVTQWSKLNQDVSSISGRVTQLEGNASTGGNVDYSLLSSSLYTYILDNYTTAGMESTWAKFAQLTNRDMQMLKWMSSGASSYANDATSTANLFAAAKNYSDNGSTISLAVSNINALVERDQNDNLVAKSAMESMVDNAITGIINTATSSQVGTTIFSLVNQNSDDIAAITTKITGDTSSASVATKLGNMSAGLITTATLDSAAASLISGSTNTNLQSAVMTKVSEGITSAQLVAASDYNAASIVAMVNAANDSSIKLSADKITLDGQTVASSIRANDITLTGHVQADNFLAGSGSSVNIKTTGSTISFCDGATEKARFVLEGSGLLLYIMDENGNWRKINWSNWTDVNATSYTPVTVYKIVNGSFDQSVVYFLNGTWYTAPNTSSGTPSGTFYIKVNPAYLEADSSVFFDYSTPVIYAPVTLTVYVDGSLDSTETIAMPIYDYNIDVYIEVTLSNSGVVETNNKIYATSNFPQGASIERDGYGITHNSRIYYGSTLKYIIPSNVSTSSIGWKYIDNTIKTVNGTTVTVTDSSLVKAESNINGTNVVQTLKYTFEDYNT